MRTRAVLVVLAMVLLAGCSLPAFSSSGGTTNDAVESPAPGTDGVREDPDSDVKGWENGVWYDESLAIDATDGLNESELALVVNRSMARVEYVRNVEFDRRVPVSVITREEYANRNADGDGGSGAEAAAVRESVRLEALFLVGESTDAQQEQEETRSASVQGFYSPSKDEITIVAPSDTPVVDEVTLAHELVHAYQFRGNIEVRFPESPTRDERRALVAVIEGDANFVDGKVADRCGSAWTCVQPGDDAADATADDDTETASTTASTARAPRPNMGLYLLSYFPYAEGEELVAQTKDDGGWAAVNDLYGDPPASTEEVIHRVDDEPTSASVPDRSGDAWSRVGSGSSGVVMGEADLATMFEATLYDDREGSMVTREQFLTEDGPVPIDYDLPPSAGWDGDVFHAYERADDDTGFVWRLEFDSDAEATEFAVAYRDLLRYHDAERERTGVFVVPEGPFADAFYVNVDGSRVTIVNAPTVDDLGDVHGPAGSDASVRSVDERRARPLAR